jgi:16S rRNA (guanine527-N7)-methyltransferase
LAGRTLADGARTLGLDLNDAQLTQLSAFVALVRATNDAFNLVSRGDVDRLETRHVLDSLSVAAYLSRHACRGGNAAPALRVADIGSGAGFPGLVIAIAQPELTVTLVDRSARKCRFLERAKSAIGLANVEIKCHDVGTVGLGSGFDVITSRAVAPVNEMWPLLVGSLVCGGLLIHMSHADPDVTPSSLDLKGGAGTWVLQDVPGLRRAHWLAVVRKAGTDD